MPTNSTRTPISERQGIKISDHTRELYKQRNKDLDKDLDSAPLSPDKWANAMRRDEYFRPIKKQTTVRIDADILAWLKSKGEGHLTRINEILRKEMNAETQAGGKAKVLGSSA